MATKVWNLKEMFGSSGADERWAVFQGLVCVELVSYRNELPILRLEFSAYCLFHSGIVSLSM
jgi:hypothetical protein